MFKPVLHYFYKHNYFEIVLGLVLFALMTILAVVFKFPYFYSLFVVGLFLLFDGLEHRLKRDIEVEVVLSKINTRVIFLLALFILFTDLIAGQIIFDLWSYPEYNSIFNWIFLYLVIYPIGGLSLLAMYRVFNILLSPMFKERHSQITGHPQSQTRILIHLLLIFTPLAVFLPILIFFTGTREAFITNQWLYGILFLFFFIEWTFLFDIVTLAYHGRPLML